MLPRTRKTVDLVSELVHAVARYEHERAEYIHSGHEGGAPGPADYQTMYAAAQRVASHLGAGDPGASHGVFSVLWETLETAHTGEPPAQMPR